MPPGRHVRRRRIDRAAAQLGLPQGAPVTEIALGAGHDSFDAFARAFRSQVGHSPAGVRAAPGWQPWQAAAAALAAARSPLMQHR